MMEIQEANPEELMCSVKNIMPFLCYFFGASEIIVLTANKEDGKSVTCGLHTYCSDEVIIEGMLRTSLDAFVRTQKQKENEQE